MDKHPILANGELYAEPVSKSLYGGPKVLPRDYYSAKERIVSSLDKLSEKITAGNEKFLEEKVVCIRLEPKFEAKSYMPQAIVNVMRKEDTQIVGGRKYSSITNGKKLEAKLYFVRTTNCGINQLRDILQKGSKDHIEQWRQQIQTINTIDLLLPDEKIMGFSDAWEKGSVEFVLHPIPSCTEKEIDTFFEYSRIDRTKSRIKTYDDGLTFISADCNQINLQKVKSYNPLRAAHPLGNISITAVRSIPGVTCPLVVQSAKKPQIKVGVFDGGADDLHPLLQGYVNEIDASIEPVDQECIAHGTGVCSAIMYGNLSGKSGKDILDAPCVMINSYRVLPLHDRRDVDLYEVVDFIERIVPSSPDIKLYNLSMGPKGAILDDSISRFTYALDRLTYEVPKEENNPLFVVAVGNDGSLPSPLNRIQSPSDMVNGLGIGAYTYNNSGEKISSDYSCVGPGREGAKTKPDLLDFGGSIDHPFIIPSMNRTGLSATAGTSFSTPLVTGKIAKLMAMCKEVSPHLARTLLIHNARNDLCVKSIEQGFGVCPDSINDILECSDKHVTILYSGFIYPTQFIKLPIFLPKINEMQGNVSLSWTVSTIVAPYSNDPDAYTNNCLEDVFTPHSMIFSFTKRGQKPQRVNLLDASKLPLVRMLIDNGYKQSSAPVSHPAKKQWDEADLRSVDLKWDTIIHKEITMRSKSLFDPALTLHAIGRNGFENEEIRYYVVVSVDAPKYKGSLYDLILNTYQNLVPIEIRAVNRILI